jgi:hypothetical protein
MAARNLYAIQHNMARTHDADKDTLRKIDNSGCFRKLAASSAYRFFIKPCFRSHWQATVNSIGKL